MTHLDQPFQELFVNIQYQDDRIILVYPKLFRENVTHEDDSEDWLTYIKGVYLSVEQLMCCFV